MTEQMSLQSDDQPGWPARTFLLAQWLATSLVIAWVTPFAVVALIAAAFGALGIDSASGRENVVAFATLEPAAWDSARSFWHGYSWVCATIVITWRVLFATPVQDGLRSVGTRVAAAMAPIAEPLGRWLAGLPRLVQALLFIAPVVALLFLDSRASETERRPVRSVARQPTAMPAPPTSAAIALPRGAIRSGQASVEQQSDSTFVVVFKTEATK